MKGPSREYAAALEASKTFHGKHKTFSGRFMLRYLDDIEMLVQRYSCKTMLDYGAGKGVQYETDLPNGKRIPEHLGVEVTKYDPAWPAFAEEPRGKFDLVICTQALGSIPVSDLPWVIDRLYGLSSRCVYVGERIKPVKKILHRHMAEVMPRDWSHEKWADALRRPGIGVDAYLRTKDNTLEGSPRRLERIDNG